MDAVGEDVATHTHVEASSLVVPAAQLPAQLMAVLAQHIAEEPDYKVRAAASDTLQLPRTPVAYCGRHTCCVGFSEPNPRR